MNSEELLKQPIVRSALYEAVLNHDFETLKKIPLYLSTSGTDMYTPLQHAIMEGNLHAMNVLQNFGVDFNGTNLFGMSALHIAAVFAAPWILEYLVLYKGVSVNHTDGERRTALHYAISFKRVSNAIQLITLAPSEISRPDGCHTTPLLEACRLDQLEIVRALLEHGARCSAGGGCLDYGDTCLHYAVRNRNLKMLELLLQTRPSLNARNRKRYTPLHTAMSCGWPEMVDRLIKAGADPKVEDASGETGLFYACRYDDCALLTALLDHGLDPLKRNWRGLGLLEVVRGRPYKRCFLPVLQATTRGLDPGPSFYRPWFVSAKTRSKRGRSRGSRRPDQN